MKKMTNVAVKHPCTDCDNEVVSYWKTNHCKSCGYKYRKRPSGLKYKIKVQNKAWFKKGQVSSMKGVERHDLRKENPGYDAIHQWISTWAEDPCVCEKCGSDRNLEWSNVSGDYKRELGDWQRLCKKCHQRYDYENFGARKVFYERRTI